MPEECQCYGRIGDVNLVYELKTQLMHIQFRKKKEEFLTKVRLLDGLAATVNCPVLPEQSMTCKSCTV